MVAPSTRQAWLEAQRSPVPAPWGAPRLQASHLRKSRGLLHHVLMVLFLMIFCLLPAGTRWRKPVLLVWAAPPLLHPSRERALLLAPPPGPVNVEALLASFKSEVEATIDAKLSEARGGLVSQVNSATAALVKAAAQQQEQVNSQAQGELHEPRQRQSSVEKEQSERRSELERIRKQLYILEAAIPIKDYEGMLEWGLDPDGTIMVANAVGNADVAKVREQLCPWLQDAGLEDTRWRLEGPSSGRRFILPMTGDANAAMRKVQKARKHIKDGNGEWRQFNVETIKGGTSRIFVGVDKAACLLRRKIWTKKLATLVKEVSFFLEGVPTINLEICAERDQATKLLWNFPAVTSQGIDKDQLSQRFNDIFHESDEVRWQI
ncbi:unnamed protein product [Prorocentrum cordatum]|uniref:Uncharacterized protein n=1 Tax=Prorocentrum cordatum TaxID=2364126 RepID=A0ABN9WCT9_9DINO|nr:unnamed protein product [Polarella glacialis]